VEKILTVVVPTYNMEKYLANCLDSFIFDKEETGLEILVVNDGSKDNSLGIAKEYEKKYPNIFKVINKENGGHGSTINAGLKVATGKYFKVVDSDDWVETEEFERLFNRLKELDIDLIICNYTNFYDAKQKSVLQNCMINKDNSVFSLNEIEKYKFIMASNTYKTEKIRNIRLQENCFYVDVEYNLYAYAMCNTCIYLNYNVYQYRLGRPGQSVSLEGMYKHREDHKKVTKKIINFFNSNKLEPNKSRNIINYIGTIIENTYKQAVCTYHLGKTIDQEIVEFDKELKEDVNFYDLTNKIKIIKNLRNSNFKNLRFKNRFFRFKRFVKKIIRK